MALHHMVWMSSPRSLPQNRRPRDRQHRPRWQKIPLGCREAGLLIGPTRPLLEPRDHQAGLRQGPGFGAPRGFRAS